MTRGGRPHHREHLETFDKYLTDNGLKRSRQREVIVDRFLASQGHMTVDELYESVRSTHPEIGRTTVYRALKLLCDAGLAETIQLADGVTRFERRYDDGHHDHIVCTGCGTILEFTSTEIERLQREIAAAHGFSVDSHRHQIFGVCTKCRLGGDDGIREKGRKMHPRRPPRRSGAEITFPLS